MQQEHARDKLQAERKLAEQSAEAAEAAAKIREEGAALAAQLRGEADALKKEAATFAEELSGEAAGLAEEVRALNGRNAALVEAEAKEAERRARLEAGVATALASFEGEARRLCLAYISPISSFISPISPLYLP